MKFRCICYECRVQDKKDFFNRKEFQGLPYPVVLNHYHFEEENAYSKKDIYIEIDVQDKRGFIFQCDKGHVSFGALNLEFYELLYDRGIFAYDDTYHREAVANLAASIERFHEYCIRRIVHLNNVEDSNLIEKTWNLVKKQSERQYGAFIFLFLNRFKELPPKIDSIKKNQDWASFRNQVVHNGYFPTREETQRAIEVTTKYIKEIKKKFEEKTESIEAFHYHEMREKEIFNGLIEEYEKRGGTDLEKVDRADIEIFPFLNVKKRLGDFSLKDDFDEEDYDMSLDEKIETFKLLNLTAYRS